MSLLVILLLLVLALSILLVVPRRVPHRGASRQTGDIDEDALERAEAELQDLRPLATPEDADDELPDWGPGVPKPPRERAEGG